MENEYTCYEIKEIQANTLAINCTGTFAVLGGRRELLFFPLDDIQDRKKIPLLTKWETSAAQWNPTDPARLATARNNRGDIYVWTPARQLNHLGSLKGHVRAISSLDWCPHEPNRLATSSVDSFRAVCIWDTRDTKKPSLAFESVSGASHFRWNRVSSNIFATAHESDVRLWDIRKGTMPTNYIAAHVSKVWDIDWRPDDENELVTCSQDCKIKIWNTTRVNSPDYETSMNVPFFRARFTPFGHGLMTMPTPYRRQETALVLWHAEYDLSPVKDFHGHTDVVMGFDWKITGQSGDVELVTWSRDQTLRLWRLNPDTIRQCGEVESSQPEEDVDKGNVGEDKVASHDAHEGDTNDEATDGTSSTESLTPAEKGPLGGGESGVVSGPGEAQQLSTTPTANSQLMVNLSHIRRSPSASKSLQKEFSLLNTSTGNYELEDLDANLRRARLCVKVDRLRIRIRMTFPPTYPTASPPIFQILASNVKLETRQIDELMKTLLDTSLENVQFSRGCVEPCIRKVIPLLETWQKELDSVRDPNDPLISGPVTTGRPYMSPAFYSMDDLNVPFPRTSGARISPCGVLVCFKRPSYARDAMDFGGRTPRALSDIAHHTEASSNPFSNLVYGYTNPSPPNGEGVTNMFRKRMHKPGPPTTTRRRYVPSFQRSKSGGAAGGTLEWTSPVKVGSSSVPSNGFGMEAPINSTNGTALNGTTEEAGEQGDYSVATTTAPTGSRLARGGSKSSSRACVYIFDVSGILPITRQLAVDYIISTENMSDMCAKNAAVAANANRRDLVQFWQCCAVLVDKKLSPSSDAGNMPPWPSMPFGRRLVQNWLEHFSRLSDVQSLAMLAVLLFSVEQEVNAVKETLQRDCNSAGVESNLQLLEGSYSGAVGPPTLSQRRATMEEDLPYNQYNQYHTITGDPKYQNQLLKGLRDMNLSRQRSNSCTEIFDETSLQCHKNEESRRNTHLDNCRFVESAQLPQLTEFIRRYGDQLYAWGLVTRRAQLIGGLSVSPDPEQSCIGFRVRCPRCRDDGLVKDDRRCGQCRRPNILSCGVCGLPVRGLARLCPVCHHGGHAEHMRTWFEQREDCPVGCGCACAQHRGFL